MHWKPVRAGCSFAVPQAAARRACRRRMFFIASTNQVGLRSKGVNALMTREPFCLRGVDDPSDHAGARRATDMGTHRRSSTAE